MTNADVVDLRKAGLDDDNLIAAIRDAAAVGFDLSPAGLKALLSAKVSQSRDHRDARAAVIGHPLKACRYGVFLT